MSVVFSHPTGNENVRAVAFGLAEANLLAGFHTSLACFSGSFLEKLSNVKPLKVIKRRSFDLALRPYIQTSPWREVGRLLAGKTGMSGFIRREHDYFSIDAVYRGIDKKVARSLHQRRYQNAKAVYAYEDGALFSFQVARSFGMKCLYDLPTGYWRALHNLLADEQERRPEWRSTLTAFNDSREKLERKDEELRLASCIFVASKFTADTLKEFKGSLSPVHVIPYGFPPVGPEKNYQNSLKGRRLKVIFVGKLSQQKGIADLFEAIAPFHKSLDLTIVGQKVTNNCAALDKALGQHNWIPTLPHTDVVNLMREHDLLLFPSLFDGFGLAISEAMSQGTPVIASNRSAGPSLINDGQNGWLMDAGAVDDLKCKIEDILQSPETIAETGRQAMKTASERPWKVYWKEMASAVGEHLTLSCW